MHYLYNQTVVVEPWPVLMQSRAEQNMCSAVGTCGGILPDRLWTHQLVSLLLHAVIWFLTAVTWSPRNCVRYSVQYTQVAACIKLAQVAWQWHSQQFCNFVNLNSITFQRSGALKLVDHTLLMTHQLMVCHVNLLKEDGWGVSEWLAGHCRLRCKMVCSGH